MAKYSKLRNCLSGVDDGVSPSPLRIVLGHEAAGVVDAVGSDVDGLAPGDPPAGVPLEAACVIGCAVQTGVGAVLNTAKDLEALVTARRPLGEIHDALADLRAGRGVRTVIDLDR